MYAAVWTALVCAVTTAAAGMCSFWLQPLRDGCFDAVSYGLKA